MAPCPRINFQLSIISKRLAKHISTKVSFKITTRNRHVYFDIGWTWIWNQCLYLGIWNDDRTKMMVCLHFISLHYEIHKTQIKLSLLIHSDNLICLWLLVFPIGIIQFRRQKNVVFDYISVPYTITDPKQLKLFSTYLVGRNGTMWETWFQLLKLRKKKISWNIKTKGVTDVHWQLDLRV